MDFFIKFVLGIILGFIIFMLFLLALIIITPVPEVTKDKYSIIEYNKHEYINFKEVGVVHNPDCGFCLSNKLEVVN